MVVIRSTSRSLPMLGLAQNLKVCPKSFQKQYIYFQTGAKS